MTDRPLVSVVVTTYERPQKVRRAIESVRDQTYDRLEVVVVEDGSDSGVEDWLDDRGFDEITYFRHDSNRGLAAARNSGIEWTSGEYVALLDDDDEWKPRRIEAQVDRLLAEDDRHNLGVVYCAVEVRTPDGEVIHRIEPRNEGELAEAIQEEGALTLSSTFLFRREALETVGGFDERLPSSVDHDIWMALAANGYRAIALEEPLVVNYDSPEADMMTDTTPRIYGVRLYVEKWRPTYREWFGPKEGDAHAEQYFADVIGRLAATKVESRSPFEAGQAMCAMFDYCSDRWYVLQLLFWRTVVSGTVRRLPEPFVNLLRRLYGVVGGEWNQ